MNTPSETQANEYRRMAEELFRRGVYDEAEDVFRRSLDLNRLDYRTYVGLGHTLLKRNDYLEALDIFNRSLPHAPIQKKTDAIRDWKSYCLRLMARIHACLGAFSEAEQALEEAVTRSPDYAEAQYDLAIVQARLGNGPGSMAALRRAIRLSPLYWYLPQRQPAFAAIQRSPPSRMN